MGLFKKEKIWEIPLKQEAKPHETLYTFLSDRAERTPNAPVLERRTSVGSWREISAKDLQIEVDDVARGLLQMGLSKGDRISIMAATCTEWTVLDLAALSLGIIVAPIYESDSSLQIEWITNDALPSLVITDNNTRLELVKASAGPSVKEILSFDNGAIRLLQSRGLQVSDEKLKAAQAKVDIDDVATIIYTSGTTGLPKGVTLTHRNFVETIYGAQEAVPNICLSNETRFLLFLPLAHVLARFVQFLILAGNGVFANVSNTKNLLGDLKTFQPSILLLVPRVLEKIYNASEAKAGKGIKRKLFRWAANAAISYSRALDTRRGPSFRQKRRLKLANRLVLHKIKAALGPKMRYIVSGGAPLSPTLGHFFRGLGLDLLEGYGLSETTGPLSITRLGKEKMGSVGNLIPGNRIKLSSEGEVLVQGAAVFAGYYNNPQATAEAFEDGWFRTGDIAKIDKKDRLYITGRAKDLIVTAGGKNVAPVALEESLVTHPLISHVVVVGDQQPYISAIVTLDAEMLPTWLKNHGLPPMDPARSKAHPKVIESILAAIKRVNKTVSKAESIRRFRFIDAEFTVENGYLTPSMKLKRAKVSTDFAVEIASLYDGSDNSISVK
ncbi:long-chain fatty acid--CoA ligase [Gleimia sp. 6138-11-ORH1]|uniref:AMP-dependent synthetase/ligase n=1 Tax=Gleimia sp. 6138-11-ORH1 TaxID=2973937 RepID=UPI002169F28A|nr:long-chain fatty acid--CoA ligase [Gleimia sp. 6138-11-ORH1]MCS4484317.1 long-chain fatty acid--CoA ligase [Gleimia sp. 6138-11-ORH1]